MDRTTGRTFARRVWRDTLGIVLAIAAAVGAIVAPLLDWYGDREGRDYRLTDLFSSDGISVDDAELFTGLFLPMLVAAVLLLIAVPLRWGWLMAVAALIVLGITILWMVRQYQVADSLSISRDGLGEGVAWALVAGVLGLVAGATTYGRGRGRHRLGEAAAAPPAVPARPAEEAPPAEAPAAAEPRRGQLVRGPWRRPGHEEPEAPVAPDREAEREEPEKREESEQPGEKQKPDEGRDAA
jgi:hypothetical protein